jgi:hypothetical protein
MKFLKVIFIIVTSLVLASCAGTGTKNFSSINYEASSDQAVLFVGRKNKFIASAGLTKIILDGQEIAKLGVGEIERVNLSVGAHKLQTKIGNVLQMGVSADSTSFIAEKGKKYFFIVDYNQKLFSAQWEIIETTEGGFQSSLN